MSDTLVDAIRVAGLHDGQLVRRLHFRGCWTYRDCPLDSDGGLPKWWVSDNTVHALIRRGIAVVTHTRVANRPAAVRVKSKTEMHVPKPVALTIIIDGISFYGFTAPDPVSAKKLFGALRDRKYGREVMKFRDTDSGAELSLTVDDAEAA